MSTIKNRPKGAPKAGAPKRGLGRPRNLSRPVSMGGAHFRKGPDPVAKLLGELRADPTEAGVQKILDCIWESRCEYFNVRKHVEKAFNRPLTPAEKALVVKLQ